MDGAACKDCVFWDALWKGGDTGQCRVNAPQLVVLSGEWRVDGQWPQTGADDWCGEFSDGTMVEEIGFTPEDN